MRLEEAAGGVAWGGGHGGEGGGRRGLRREGGGGGGRGARATNTAVRNHATGLVCSAAALRCRCQRATPPGLFFLNIHIYIYLYKLDGKLHIKLQNLWPTSGTGDPLQPHNSSTEGAQPLRMGGVQTAECYGLHCLFKSMLGGLCSFAKEGWQGSKASEAKAAKKVLKTELSL